MLTVPATVLVGLKPQSDLLGCPLISFSVFYIHSEKPLIFVFSFFE